MWVRLGIQEGRQRESCCVGTRGTSGDGSQVGGRDGHKGSQAGSWLVEVLASSEVQPSLREWVGVMWAWVEPSLGLGM